MKTTYKAQRRYGKTNKTMFKSENKQEVLDFMKKWKSKNGVKLHLIEV